jgi:ATP-dependent DNA ligase
MGLEGIVAKRSDGVYQPGQRTGLWSKYRINLGQEFVIGGYVPSHLGIDSLVVGFAARVEQASFQQHGVRSSKRSST